MVRSHLTIQVEMIHHSLILRGAKADFDDALLRRGFPYCSCVEKTRGPFPRKNNHEIDGP